MQAIFWDWLGGVELPGELARALILFPTSRRHANWSDAIRPDLDIRDNQHRRNEMQVRSNGKIRRSEAEWRDVPDLCRFRVGVSELLVSPYRIPAPSLLLIGFVSFYSLS